nr:uncharacterized protein LOC108943743 isoform X1 [Nicotiana tomentosiformis]XP_033509937.1 uncharacterized protein LOC108943743 isoform X2 [Nicotiana tomentosiformis]
MMFLPRFCGDGNPDSWIFRAELYFTYLGFSEKDWLPLPYFYLDGEALAWFTWLHRNKQFFDWMHFKEKLCIRFRQRTFTDSVSREDTSRSHVDYVSYVALVPQATSVSPVATLSHVPNSSDLEAAFNGGNSEAANVFDKFSNGANERDSHELPSSVPSPKIQVASDSVELEPIDYTDCDTTTLANDEKPNAQIVFHATGFALEVGKISHVNKVFTESPKKDALELLGHVSYKKSWLIPFLACYEYVQQHDKKFAIVNGVSAIEKFVLDTFYLLSLKIQIGMKSLCW